MSGVPGMGPDESSWPGAWMEDFVVNNRFETCKAYGRYPLDMDVITTRITELTEQGAGLGWEVKKPDAQKDVQAARKRRPRRKRTSA